jgi:hypothetical protein
MFVFIFSSSHALAIGDRERDILAIMGSVYVLGKIVNIASDEREKNHTQVQNSPHSIHQQNIMHEHLQDDRNYHYGQQRKHNGNSLCNDEVSCAYQKGVSDGVQLRNITPKYCSFYSGC